MTAKDAKSAKKGFLCLEGQPNLVKQNASKIFATFARFAVKQNEAYSIGKIL